MQRVEQVCEENQDAEDKPILAPKTIKNYERRRQEEHPPLGLSLNRYEEPSDDSEVIEGKIPVIAKRRKGLPEDSHACVA